MTTKTVALSYPITVGGKTISEVVFRRPKGRDMRLLGRLGDIEEAQGGGEPKGEAASEASSLMIRAVTGLSEAEFDELDLMEDIPRLTEEAADFLESIAPPEPASGEA